jgi:Ring finger domain
MQINNNDDTAIQNNSNNENRANTSPSPALVRCYQCGHNVPADNWSLHHATCRGRRIRHPPAVTTEQRTATAASADTIRCSQCGKQVSTMSAVAHEARCCPRRLGEESSARDNFESVAASSDEVELIERSEGDVEVVVAGTQHDASLSAASAVTTNESSAAVATTTTATITTESGHMQQRQQHQQHQWSCPQCTLLNPNTTSRCDACGFSNPASGTPPNNSNVEGVQVEVHEVDPRVVSAVTGAAAVASWTLLGAFLGGPVGALVGGSLGALLTGASHWQQSQQPPNDEADNNNHRPRFVFTSTRITQTPTGSVIQVTNNASGRMRTTVIRSSNGGGDVLDFSALSLADRMILQMLRQNALNQGALNVDQMTYDELLQRFGVGTEHRGASPETIHALPLETLNSEDAIQSLEENQKTCNICLEDFVVGDSMRKLECSHAFHESCIDNWLARVSSCPICKKEIQPNHGGSPPR